MSDAGDAMKLGKTAFLFAAALSAACLSHAGAPQLDDASFRKTWHVDEATALYFRKADGSPISEQDFLNAVSQRQPYFAEEPAYNGKLVFMLGENVEWGLISPDGGRASKLKKGDQMPLFELTTVDGQHLSNAMFKGKVTLIDFFAYACGPCIEEMPALNAYKAAHPNVQTLAVAPDNDVYIRDIVRNEHFSWATAANAAVFFKALQLRATPTLALVDGQGRMVAMRAGSIKAPNAQTVTQDSISQWVQSQLASQH